MKKILFTLFISSLYMGCAVTRISSIKAPRHGSYSKILIYARYSDNDTREAYETAIAQALIQKNIHVWRSIDIFSPLKEYTDSAIQAIYKKDGFEALLILKPNGTSTTRRTDVYENWYGGISADSYDDLSGIYCVATLMLPEEGEKIYQASTATSLGKYTAMETARQSFAEKLADDLDNNNYLHH